MEILWFIAQLVGVLAWPALVLTVALIIRRDLNKIDKEREKQARYYYDLY